MEDKDNLAKKIGKLVLDIAEQNEEIIRLLKVIADQKKDQA